MKHHLRTASLIASFMIAASSSAVGQTHSGHDHDPKRPGQSTAPATGLQELGAATEGEVRKVDVENRKLTLRHGEIKNLGMPAMTMVFQVKDIALLDKVKVGDKIRFAAEKVDGAFVVIALDPVK
jgi:Cu(I)/Ag(I) efflux system periplasmic protein CusF